MEQQSKILEQYLAISKQHTDVSTQISVSQLEYDSLNVCEEEEDEVNDWVSPALEIPEPSVSQEANPNDQEDNFFEFAPC